MAKDPAFLFYSKDWLEGTAEMTPDEKGVYIDLLAHQHQKGSLPADTKRLAKMVGLSEDEFLQKWALLKNKFNRSDDRLVNRKLSEITTERLSKSHTNRITGKFATLIRSVKHLSKYDVETLKKEFKITDFDHLPTELATERLTEWFYIRLESIGNANAIENANIDIGGVGENSEGLCWDIEQHLLKNQKDMEAICMNTKKTIDELKTILTNFHLWNVQNEVYPKKPLPLMAGFTRWVLNDKKFNKNGSHSKLPSEVGRTLKRDRL